jgi:hypothetical protein
MSNPGPSNSNTQNLRPIAWADDIGSSVTGPDGQATGYTNTGTVSGVLTVTGAAALDAINAIANTVKIQTALDAQAAKPGGGIVTVYTNGQPFYISSTLQIGDNTTLDLGRSEMKAFGVVGNLLVNKAYATINTAASTTVTWSSGLTASVAWANHGLTTSDFAWLSRANEGMFNGVFSIASITDANNFVVNLRRIPAGSPTGTTLGQKANVRVRVINGIWNYNNSGGNAPSTALLKHAVILAGIYDLQISNIYAKDTFKYVLNIGAVTSYSVDGVKGGTLNSDLMKLYGPAYSGNVSNLSAGQSGDDLLSIQTKPGVAFVADDYTQGDILGLKVDGISGQTTTSAFVVYPNAFGVVDGVTVNNCNAVCAAGMIRIDSEYATGAEVGTLTINDMVAPGTYQGIVIGTGSNAVTIKSLVVNNPRIRSASSASRLFAISGTAVTADLTVVGGYITGAENLINLGLNAVVSAKFIGTHIGSIFVAFRLNSSGTLNLDLQDVTFDSTPSSAFISNNAGTPVINLRARNVNTPADPVITLTGTPTFNIFSPDMRIDVGATGFNKTTVNQSCVNTNAGGARGTLVTGQPVICNGTNWLQSTALGNLF